MIEIYSVKVGDADENLLNDVIELKSQAWNYDYASQKKWIKDNLTPSDRHFLLKKDGALTAYLNLVNLSAVIDGKNETLCGIGNVCVRRSELCKNYGLLIMNAVNCYIKDNCKKGFLLCRPELAAFYKKASWIALDGKTQVFIEASKFFNDALYYNACFDGAEKIIIDRNF